ncbi:hypothetical protein JKP88DRAFT_240950 [Tribonema minus]|uniref:DNA primase/polymerase bifunctional N-terminal domain-containing protein n=1 Tax=Tribonema minus TaxID=303371 RepID=A0A835ZCB0_9STRA|nr:hypothetical protein JKP88DRAFT_240950 [Tribonema minus]
MQENVWTPLASWLLATYPDDVLMPVKKGCKAPMFAHSNGQWSWGRFDEFCERRPVANYNVAILLRTLCVVDVDSHDIVVDLEQRFPCLKSCPSETTRKGKHFFFKRSALCDSAEFYDQRSTVVSMVDFKTISATGTSSVIVVGPSENKTWVKTPWSMGDVLQEIPEHLLRAVAIPMHKTASVIFSFPTGEDLVVHKNQHLYKFDLVTSIIGDESDGEVQEAQEVPLYHGSAQLMRELLFFLENRRYSTWLVDVREIERLADYACGTPTVMRSLSSTNPASPTAWITSIDGVSREWAAAYVSGDIIDISTLQPHITYTPLAKDDKWLLESAPHIDLPRGTPMLRADILEYAGQHLPTPVQLILQVFPNVVLAGSSALDIACPHILTAPSDYDFYIFGVDTEEQAIGIIDGIKEIVKPETVTQTGSALTMLVEDEDQGEVTIQIILRRYGSIKHIINSFDVAPCQALFHGGKLWVSASWVFAIKHMAMFVNFHKWTTSSVSRVFKYYSKGFERLHARRDGQDEDRVRRHAVQGAVRKGLQ